MGVRVVQIGARSHSDVSRSDSQPTLLTVMCTAPQDKGPLQKAPLPAQQSRAAPQWAGLSPKMQTLNVPKEENGVEEESLPNVNTETSSANVPQQANEAPLK